MTDRAIKKLQRNRWPALAPFYANLIPRLVQIGREHGYAMAIHGSMTTDLDIVAIPWIDEAAKAEDLIEAVRVAVDGHIPDTNDPVIKEQFAEHFKNPADRPHGRKAWSMYLHPEHIGPYLDISVMPRTAPAPDAEPRQDGKNTKGE